MVKIFAFVVAAVALMTAPPFTPARPKASVEHLAEARSIIKATFS